MATYTSAASGLWSAGATWSGGVKPPSGAGHKIVLASPYIVEYDEAAGEYGDDTTTGITVQYGATLKFSRAMSTKLTVVGNLLRNGNIDGGTEVDPIQNPYVAQLVLNKSSAMANGKYGFTTTASSSGAGLLSFWGADKTPFSRITSVSSSTTFDVADATGWLAGDWLVFGPTTPGIATVEARAVSSVTPTAGTAATVVLTAGSTNSHFVGRAVANVTRNVKILTHESANYSGALVLGASSLHVNAQTSLGNVELVGRLATALGAGVNPQVVYASQIGRVYRPAIHDIAAVSGSTVTAIAAPGGAANSWMFTVGCRASTPMEQVLIATAFGSQGINCVAVGNAYISGGWIIGASVPAGMNGGSGSSFSINLDGTTIEGVGTKLAIGTFLRDILYKNCYIDGYPVLATSSGFSGSLTLSGCDLDGPIGVTSPTALTDPAAGMVTVLDNCALPGSVTLARSASYLTSPENGETAFLRKGQDPTVSERYTARGKTARDNSVVYRGTSSVRIEPWFAGVTETASFVFTVGAAETATIIGAMRVNTDYGAAYPPTATITGAGITTVVATGPTAADTWQAYTLSVTNPGAAPADFTLTYAARTAFNGSTASAWFDGVVNSPWVDEVRHYGYLWDNEPHLTADPTITISEAAALALAVSVDHDYQIITVSGALTNAEVYQACMADLAKTSSLYPTLRAVHITSDDGEDFETTYDVVLDGGSPTSIITGPYTDAAGRHVLIEAPAVVSGSRVQVYDVTAATELYNGVLSGAGLSINATWTTNHTIRLRSRIVGKQPLISISVLTEAGLIFSDIQDEDPVYAENAIDGATCDVSGGGEFEADEPNVQVDLSDSDGRTLWQRFYAWWTWYETTEAGIAGELFGRFTARDSRNYYLTQILGSRITFQNIDPLTPVLIEGGSCSTSDGLLPIDASVGMGALFGEFGRSYTSRDIEATVTRTEKWLRNKRVTDPTAGTQTVYDDDGVTVLGVGALYEDVAGTQIYRGEGADRAERLA